ncbi:ErfK/YbiS/YcfS/YnhG family protein [hydrothermal vent metagenome]|uniref:ErfK/YbiS/YcfS/YnhG family protein n=1 Tax=hydrothermal vent metagenome TaxID=652676 RepID=A0A1W1E8P6_9ZZZZ
MKIKILGFIVITVVLFIGGCGKPTYYGKVDKTPYETRECLRQLAKGAEIRQDQIIDRLVAYKSKRLIEGYRNGKKVFASRMSLGKNGDKGNKIGAGDYRTPEGSYTIVRKKCDPRLYRSLMISYPNAADRARAKAHGVKPGGYITIHGQPKWNADGRGDAYTLAHDWTEGCMAVPNKKMLRLWKGVRNGVPITIYP